MNSYFYDMKGQNVILFDDRSRVDLLPLTFTRPVADIRIGILTIREKWERHLETSASTHTQDYLGTKYPSKIESENLLINGSVLPNSALLNEISNLKDQQALVSDDRTIAAISSNPDLAQFLNGGIPEGYEVIKVKSDHLKIVNLSDIFRLNGDALTADYELLTKGKNSQSVSDGIQIIGDSSQLFIEEGATISASVINVETGPVYIGRNAEIMEGALIRGPFALCDHSTVKMGAKIYGATTVGPHSKVGGEIHNSIFTGYSNKAHDGFLGNSVIGEWCNLGADTNNSNLKNNYGNVKLWNYEKEGFKDTGLQFCGLMMGDHSKCGINTMFNTGTIVGVSANIFGSGFPRNFIPSFSWGGTSGFTTYKIDQALDVARIVMGRRDLKLEENDEKILQTIFDLTSKYRSWENN